MAEENYRWQSRLSLAQSMNEMRKNDHMTDVTFLVGSDQRTQFQAHKVVLVGRSPVFQAMLTRTLAEKGDVSIPDIEPDVFEIMLRCIYEDKVNLPYESLDHLLYAAEKYDLSFMKHECTTLLQLKLRKLDDLFNVLEIALKYNLTDIAEKSAKLIAQNPVKYFDSNSFLNIKQETLKMVLSNNKLSLDEGSVFSYALKWAEHVCVLKNLCVCGDHLRECLGPVLYEIQFPNISGEFFCNKVIPENILTSKEMCDIFQSYYIENKKCIFKNDRKNTSCEPKHFSTYINQWILQNEVDAVKFQTSKNIMLRGVSVCGSCNGQATHHCTLTLYNTAMEKLSTSTIKTKTFPEKEVYNLLFPKPVPIKANVIYTISLQALNSNSWRGTGGLEAYEKNGVKLSFQNSDICTNGKDVFIGQIPNILFSV